MNFFARHTQWVWAILGIAFMALVVVITYSLLNAATTTDQIHDTQLEGTPTGKKLLAAANQIQSCTTPEGKCYQENQKRTARFLSQQNRATRDIVIATLSCSDQGVRGTGPLTACVDRTLGTAPKP